MEALADRPQLASPDRPPVWRSIGASAVPILAGTLPFLLLVAVALDHVNRPWVSRGDYAFMELATRSAAHGDALVGPYSRFGWNHPGPAMFYWFAPFFQAFDEAPESLGVAAAALNALAAGVAVAVSGIASGRRAAWTTAAGLLAMVWLWGFTWMDRIWNPFIVLAAIVVSGFLLAGVLADRRWMLPPLVIAASFTIQSHVGTAAIVVLFAAAAAVGVGWSLRRDWRAWRLPLGTSLAVAVALWALPVHEQLSGRDGNITQMVEFARSSKPHPTVGEVLDKIAVQLTLTERGVISNVVSAKRELPGATSGRLVVLALLVGVAVAGLFLNRRAGRRFEQHLCAVALLGALGVFGGSLRIVGELEGYLTLPATAVGALLWAAALLTVTGEVADLAWRRLRFAPGRLLVPVAVVVLLAGVGLGRWILQQEPDRTLQVGRYPDRDAVAVSDDVRTAVPAGTREVLVIPVASSALTAGVIANQLERRGLEVRAPAEWDHFFGRERRSDGCERYAVRIGPRGAPPRPGGGEVLGVFEGWVVQGRIPERPRRCP